MIIMIIMIIMITTTIMIREWMIDHLEIESTVLHKESEEGKAQMQREGTNKMGEPVLQPDHDGDHRFHDDYFDDHHRYHDDYVDDYRDDTEK